MPVSVRKSPFDDQRPEKKPSQPRQRAKSTKILRLPQARVLAVLQPDSVEDPLIDWPVVTRAQLGVRTGCTAISGTITRALNGIPRTCLTGEAHLGLLGLGYVEEVVLDIEGVKEVNYRATAAGVRAYQAHVAASGPLPPQTARALCINDRFTLKKLATVSLGWTREEGQEQETYRRDLGKDDFLRVIKFEDGERKEWVVARSYPDGGKGAHAFPSLKKVIEYLRET